MVERVAPTIRYVFMEGPVTRTAPRTDAQLLEMTQRYLRPDIVQSYIEYAKTDLPDEVAIYMQPERWLSADLGTWPHITSD